MIWVIMTSDYPAGVATTEADKERMVAELNAKYRARWKEEAISTEWMRTVTDPNATRVHVSAHAFEPNKVEP